MSLPASGAMIGSAVMGCSKVAPAVGGDVSGGVVVTGDPGAGTFDGELPFWHPMKAVTWTLKLEHREDPIVGEGYLPIHRHILLL